MLVFCCHYSIARIAIMAGVVLPMRQFHFHFLARATRKMDYLFACLLACLLKLAGGPGKKALERAWGRNQTVHHVPRGVFVLYNI